MGPGGAIRSFQGRRRRNLPPLSEEAGITRESRTEKEESAKIQPGWYRGE